MIYEWKHPVVDGMPKQGESCLLLLRPDPYNTGAVVSGRYNANVSGWIVDHIGYIVKFEAVDRWMSNPFMTDAVKDNTVNTTIKVASFTGDIGELSDGYHTFNSLYEQRMYLTVALMKNIPGCYCWKSKCHSDGEPCFGGDWFIVGFDTPDGQFTYHYEMKYWDLFDCKELPKADP